MMRVVLSFAVATTLVSACGNDSGGDDEAAPTVVVTSNILGDIVSEVVGSAGHVEVIFPLGADPHEFAASTRQAEAMADADLLVINGGGFEAGLDDAIDAATDGGARRFAFADHTELHDEDPHLWTDPTKLIPGVEALADALVDAGLDESVQRRANDYIEELRALDADIMTTLADVPADRRQLVTNHEVFGYFAERYGFEVIGAVIPSVTTDAAASAADIEALAATLEEAGVPAIFGETSSPSRLARALADTVGGEVQVVELYTESLGDEDSGAATYLDMMHTDARLIHDALGAA